MTMTVTLYDTGLLRFLSDQVTPAVSVPIDSTPFLDL